MLGLICLVAMPVSAADNVRNITTYSICREDLYKDQIEDRMVLQQISIESGKTVSFYDSNGSMFYVSGGTTVTFRVNLNLSSSVNDVLWEVPEPLYFWVLLPFWLIYPIFTEEDTFKFTRKVTGGEISF